MRAGCSLNSAGSIGLAQFGHSGAPSGSKNPSISSSASSMARSIGLHSQPTTPKASRRAPAGGSAWLQPGLCVPSKLAPSLGQFPRVGRGWQGSPGTCGAHQVSRCGGRRIDPRAGAGEHGATQRAGRCWNMRSSGPAVKSTYTSS
jgi:hypothetical protein